jgi:hypothetical protein
MKKLILLSVLSMISLNSFASLEDVSIRKVSCNYKIVNGPSESRMVYTAYSMSSPGYSLNASNQVMSCAAFFSEMEERLNPKGNLAVEFTVNNEVVSRRH